MFASAGLAPMMMAVNLGAFFRFVGIAATNLTVTEFDDALASVTSVTSEPPGLSVPPSVPEPDTVPRGETDPDTLTGGCAAWLNDPPIAPTSAGATGTFTRLTSAVIVGRPCTAERYVRVSNASNWHECSHLRFMCCPNVGEEKKGSLCINCDDFRG